MLEIFDAFAHDLKIIMDNTQAFAYFALVNRAAQQLGRLGGKAGKGKAKARTSEQARAAVMARWNKTKARKKRRREELEHEHTRN
jgi:molybdopterin/thiamine biosynthesis adenylyltransferase